MNENNKENIDPEFNSINNIKPLGISHLKEFIASNLSTSTKEVKDKPFYRPNFSCSSSVLSSHTASLHQNEPYLNNFHRTEAIFKKPPQFSRNQTQRKNNLDLKRLTVNYERDNLELRKKASMLSLLDPMMESRVNNFQFIIPNNNPHMPNPISSLSTSSTMSFKEPSFQSIDSFSTFNQRDIGSNKYRMIDESLENSYYLSKNNLQNLNNEYSEVRNFQETISSFPSSSSTSSSSFSYSSSTSSLSSSIPISLASTNIIENDNNNTNNILHLDSDFIEEQEEENTSNSNIITNDENVIEKIEPRISNEENLNPTNIQEKILAEKKGITDEGKNYQDATDISLDNNTDPDFSLKKEELEQISNIGEYVLNQVNKEVIGDIINKIEKDKDNSDNNSVYSMSIMSLMNKKDAEEEEGIEAHLKVDECQPFLDSFECSNKETSILNSINFSSISDTLKDKDFGTGSTLKDSDIVLSNNSNTSNDSTSFSNRSQSPILGCAITSSFTSSILNSNSNEESTSNNLQDDTLSQKEELLEEKFEENEGTQMTQGFDESIFQVTTVNTSNISFEENENEKNSSNSLSKFNEISFNKTEVEYDENEEENHNYNNKISMLIEGEQIFVEDMDTFAYDKNDIKNEESSIVEENKERIEVSLEEEENQERKRKRNDEIIEELSKENEGEYFELDKKKVKSSIEYKELWLKRKKKLEEEAEKRAAITCRLWQNENLSLEDAINSSLKGYIDLYETAHALRYYFESEKIKFTSKMISAVNSRILPTPLDNEKITSLNNDKINITGNIFNDSPGK